MENRFARLYSLPENLYQIDAPVLISAGALLKDNPTGNLLVQLKLKNISSKDIKAVTVGIISYDTVGRELDEVKMHQFLDLKVKRDVTFGEQTPIWMEDSSVRSYGVYVAEVAYSDNTIWTGEKNQWANRIVSQPLSEVLKDNELQKQYAIALDMPLAKYVPTEVEDLWICTCGAINRAGESNCHTCDRILQRMQEELDIDKLTYAKEQRLAEIRAKEEAERAERERQAEIARQKRAETTQKTKKIMKVVLPVACVIVLICFVVTTTAISNRKYNDAVALMNAGEYGEAVSLLATISDYKDSKQLMCDMLNTTRGTLKNKTVVSAGYNHTVGLKADGTVMAAGYNVYGECEVEDWTDIVSISASDFHTVGLKANGTVVAVGYTGGGQCDVDDWTGIVAISAGFNQTVGLKANGTVIAAGDNDYGECNIWYWRDIVSISTGFSHTVGLKSDGTVVAVGDNWQSQCEVEDWTDIVSLSASDFHTVGLKEDGTVVATVIANEDYDDGQCDVEDWTDIVSISAGSSHTVGLKADGTVVAVGDNRHRQCDVEDWTGIVAISAGYNHTVGLKADGTVVAVGDNDYEQCEVEKLNLCE